MKRLFALDGLRGVAALVVVFWHWQHFYALTGVWQAGWLRESQPFFPLLRPLYEAGWAAVDVFFALSGFVFFWLYSAAIAKGAMGVGRFSLLRFSRLYPLHFATLVLVGVMQFFFHRQTGQYFIYYFGGWARLAAALVLAQQWLPPTIVEYFNGPAWSVSIEVLLYIAFFAACRLGLGRPCWMALLVLGGLALLPVQEYIARGLAGFFLGGLVWRACEQIKQRPDAARIARLLGWAALAGWALAMAEGYTGVAHGWLAAVAPDWADEDISNYIFLLPFILIVTPLTIAALALQEQLLGRRYRALSFLGDISYSTYLLHFPLQLLCVLAALHFGWTSQTFMNPVVMIGFFAALIALGAVSHYGFERPVQTWIRRRYEKPALRDEARVRS